jgi:hypothetical protein
MIQAPGACSVQCFNVILAQYAFTNVRLGRKVLPGANTRAYFATSLVTKNKSHTKYLQYKTFYSRN